ncbi:MAG: hypothetical protein J6J42_05595 [Lachnospiraceae bacterium]|nr:hypothetical protein [Lachnospiraceae bacterium]
MNVIPNMKYPEVEQILVCINDKFPCAKEAEQVILDETAHGNVLTAVGDAGCMPDETVVVLDFAEDAKKEYQGSEIKSWGKDKQYRFVRFLDKQNGVLYIRFFIS